MARLQVKGYSHLVREVSSGGIVNTDVSEYQTYMKRIKMRNEQGDQIRSAVKEINNLKSELREIKGLIKELVNGS
tara:strand:+ start:156 stop:380 length:225 start_codon:yes stop_codon:yes gene_type:complete